MSGVVPRDPGDRPGSRLSAVHAEGGAPLVRGRILNNGAKMTPEMVNQLVAAKARGDSYRAIGTALGVPHTTLSRLVARDSDLRRRIKTEQARLRRNERSVGRRASKKARANDPTYTPGSRPEHDPAPEKGTPEREAWDAANAAVTSVRRAAESDQASTPPALGPATATRARKGTRCIPMTGNTIFDPPLAFARAPTATGIWQPRAPTTQELDERASMLTARDPKGSHVYRIDPSLRDEYERGGFLVS